MTELLKESDICRGEVYIILLYFFQCETFNNKKTNLFYLFLI